MINEHGVTLLESELCEIMNIVREMDGHKKCIRCKGVGGFDVVNEVGDLSFKMCSNCKGTGFC